MCEPACADPLHVTILAKVVELLDAPAFGSVTVAKRDQLARLMHRAHLYNYHGDGREDLIADETPELARPLRDVVEPIRVRDERTAEQRAAHEKLEGTWWHCPAHGLTGDPITLCHASYCPADGCNRAVLLVSRWKQERRA